MFDTVRLILYGKKLAVNASGGRHIEIKGQGKYLPYHPKATSTGYVASNIKKISLPGKEQADFGIYTVRIDESQPRDRVCRINLEFSIPKFLLGSNLYELNLSSGQYQLFRQRLFDHLKGIVADLSIEDIDNAVIARLDISKNIVLSASEFSINWFINLLNTYDVGSRFEITEKTFQNGKRNGKIVTFHNKQQGIKFYDKLEELLNHDSYLIGEQSIAKQVGRARNHVLRIERSLQNYNAVNSELKKHFSNKLRGFTIQEVWSINLARKLLVNMLDTVTAGNIDIFTSQNNAGDILGFEKLLKRNSYTQACKIYVTQKFITQVGHVGFSSLLKDKVKRQTIKQYIKEALKADTSSKQLTISAIWSAIYSQIDHGELITTDNWQRIVISDGRN